MDNLSAIQVRDRFARATAQLLCATVLGAATALAASPPSQTDLPALAARAEAELREFQIDAALADFAQLAHSSGPKTEDYLQAAAELALAVEDWDQALALQREIVARHGKAGDAKARNALWQIAQIEAFRGDHAKRLAALEAFIARYRADKASSALVFAAYTAVGEVHTARGDTAAAARADKRTLAAFKAGGFAKDGGPEATAAARAGFMRLLPRVQALLAVKLVVKRELSTAKRVRDVWDRADRLRQALFGPEVVVADEEVPVERHRTRARGRKAIAGAFTFYPVVERCGTCALADAACRARACGPRPGANGVLEAYRTGVIDYGAPVWSSAAFAQRARLFKHCAREAFAADEALSEPLDYNVILEDAVDSRFTKIGNACARLAEESLQTGLIDAQVANTVHPWVTELRAEMHKYRPKYYPLFHDEKLLLRRPESVAALAASLAALPSAPTNPELLRQIGEAYVHAKRLGLARLAFRRAEHLAHETAAAQAVLSLIHLRYGLLAVDATDWELARAEFTRATQLRPTDADAWNNLGVAWIAARNGEQALAAIERALQLQPALLEARINLGSAWRVSHHEQRVANAKDAYDSALKDHPKQPDLLFNLGLLYLENRIADAPSDEVRYQQAIDYFTASKTGRPVDDGAPAVDKLIAEATRLRDNERTKRLNAEKASREIDAAKRSQTEPAPPAAPLHVRLPPAP